MSRIVLAMSGGVDSSVAAHLLVSRGHDVIGVFMRHGEESIEACRAPDGSTPLLPIHQQRSDHKQGCCSASDAEDARRVADRLGIPFYALNLREDFRRIIDYFVDEYSNGRTPNPCVMCNNWLKFGRLFDYADSIGAEFVATGHYARLTNSPGDRVPSLRRGVDGGKDQSYVLFGIDRELLSRMMLPVGDYRKTEIRRIASELGLRVADKRDSQEICFVTSGKHDEFVRARRRAAANQGATSDLIDSSDTRPESSPDIHACADIDSDDSSGDFVTTEGTVVGRHAGIERFTIGQRKGLGVAFGEPRYVVKIEASTRRVVLGTHDELARDELTADRCNWLADPPTGPFRCEAKIRYNTPPAAAVAEQLANGRLHIRFDEPRFGVAPGQAVVCYDGDRVLGGGWIESSQR